MSLCSRSTLSVRFLSLSHDFKATWSCNEPYASYAEHLSDIISNAGAGGKEIWDWVWAPHAAVESQVRGGHIRTKSCCLLPSVLFWLLKCVKVR